MQLHQITYRVGHQLLRACLATMDHFILNHDDSPLQQGNDRHGAYAMMISIKLNVDIYKYLFENLF